MRPNAFSPGAAQGLEPVDHVRRQPDVAFTPFVGLVFVAHATERQRPSKRLDADRDPDHRIIYD